MACAYNNADFWSFFNSFLFWICSKCPKQLSIDWHLLYQENTNYFNQLFEFSVIERAFGYFGLCFSWLSAFVFAGYKSGFGALIGPTGGYIVGFCLWF